MMKYTIVETRSFTGGTLKGITIEQETLSYSTEIEAANKAAERIGQTGGGKGFGSPYKVVRAQVLEERV
jgi:hypothetical protein